MPRASSPYLPIPPVAVTSLASDAPGYGGDSASGPICWKCRAQMLQRRCPVCQGRGRLPVRVLNATGPGKITRGRRNCFADAATEILEWGPDPVAFQQEPFYGALVQRANRDCVDIVFGGDDDKRENDVNSVWVSPQQLHMPPPVWLPIQQSQEELCHLTGSWRILQRRGSHRWTTDDLVTAAVAAQAILSQPSSSSSTSRRIQYCDLGTGNASVLQMVLWKCLSAANITMAQSLGLEARMEAVQVARRSLAFNVGTTLPVSIVHTDFRIYCSEHNAELAEQFDLVTGTPPYFGVDFDAAANETTIRQGGMPSAVQSAPARCEFRGGFEAYCVAAALLLKPQTGLFCVCENYLNHRRALAAFDTHGLVLQKMYKIEGKVGRGTLFCVYVVKKKKEDDSTMAQQPLEEEQAATVVELAVRDENGSWTEEYRKIILNYMGIPN